MWIGLAVVIGIGIAIAIGLVMKIDNWSRDFSQNFAETTEDASDPDLRPLDAAIDVPAMTKQVENVVAELSQVKWESATTNEDGSADIHLTHTSLLFRFVDDVKLHIVPRASGCRVEATSQSRIGKGDLGQNPRNLKKILRALRSQQ
jgi:uncharacterized protein (DUF1499 family)